MTEAAQEEEGGRAAQAPASEAWTRVAALRPRLRDGVTLHRHVYRGRRWFVLRDPLSGRCHRITPAAWTLVGWMDGARSVEAIWRMAEAQLGDEAPSRDETVRLLGLLHEANALGWEVSPDLEAMFEQARRRVARERRARFLNPLSIRIGLFDPDRFLGRSAWLVRPLFTRTGGLLLALWLAAGATVAVLHAPELTSDLPERLLGGHGWIAFLAVYVVMKACHELAHGFAAKVFGSEVHEMGISFLVFAPLPYVDVSEVAVLPERGRRIAVSLAGVAAELTLSALAVFVWVAVADGWVRDVALQAIWIGTLSSLLFNANPLLRFDGYYALADALEIPNLQQRASQFVVSLVQYYGFGLTAVRWPVDEPGERYWLGLYGVASGIYRTLLAFVIAWFVATKVWVVGVAIAAWTIAMQIVWPLARGLAFVAASPRLAERRSRAVALTAAVGVAAVCGLFLLPVPLHTRAEGVVWLPNDAQVRAEVDARIVRLLAAPGSFVERGAPLVQLDEPLLEAEVRALEARRAALVSRRYAEEADDLVRARITDDEIDSVDAALDLARERHAALLVRSPASGRFLLDGADPIGRMAGQGELLGHVVPAGHATVRVVLSEDEVDLVRERTRRVEVRLASDVGRVRGARIRRHVPAASDRLPSPALGPIGGGAWPVDPADPDGRKSSEPVFQLDLELDASASGPMGIGERVHARFAHDPEPLAARIGRAGARLFLGTLGG